MVTSFWGCRLRWIPRSFAKATKVTGFVGGFMTQLINGFLDCEWAQSACEMEARIESAMLFGEVAGKTAAPRAEENGLTRRHGGNCLDVGGYCRFV